MKKKLPIGIDDFKTLIENDYYFFDKSMLIDELLEKKHAVTLLPRPRRFGKTLNMSMLKYFFDIEKKEETKDLFKGLNIEKTDKLNYQGNHPVIFISLKDIKPKNYEDFCIKMKNFISNLFHGKKYLLENLDEKETNDFNNILLGKETGDYITSLLKLSKYLADYHKKNVVVLIDEYDSPMISSYLREDFEDIKLFFRGFFGSCLKGNPYLELAVMTGILRISKESIFSDLNNLDVSTILVPEYNHFGVKQNEVEEIIKYYELGHDLEEVKKWYNGYMLGDELVVNPWSILKFVSRNKLDSYWINTSENTLIKEILNNHYEILLKDLEKLASGDCVEKYISDAFVFDDLKNPTYIWSLLLFSGYLTYNDKKKSRLTLDYSYSIKIPNLEVQSFFGKTFIEISQSKDISLHNSMLESLIDGNLEEFEIKFKEIYETAISYYDTPINEKNNEKYYHFFMLGLLITLSDLYTVTSNRESGKGRYDIALEPKDKNNYGLIFEFKLADESNTLEKAKEALEQIETKKYYANMKNNGISKIIKVGIAFGGKEVEVKSKVEI